MNPIEWFYAKGDKHSGPVNSVELKRMATAGELTPNDLVWREGMADWTVARNVRGLFEEENKPAGHANAVGTAAQNLGAPPKVIDPVAMHSATVATASAAFATTTPQVQRSQRRSKHLFDLLLDLVRTQFSAAFVESTTKLFVTVGKYGLFAAMVMTLAFSLLLAMKTENYEDLLGGFIDFLVLAVLQYVGLRFCESLVRLNRNTSANVSSTAFLDCFALLGIAIGTASLIGFLGVAIAGKEFGWIVPGLAWFIVCQYLAFIALNPSTINIGIVPESRAGEEAIGLISFLVKAHLKLVPVIFGTFAVLGSVLLLYAGVEIFTDAGPTAAQLIASNARHALHFSAALPFVAYLIFLLIFLLLDLCRAILVLPSKLEKSENPEAK